MAKSTAKILTPASIGAPGADSSAEVIKQIHGRTLLEHAQALFGSTPRFWGRYFKTPEQAGGTQYNPKTEHAPLANAGIRVVPIARQTGRIHGSKTDGAQDAQGNVLAVFSAFGMQYLSQLGSQFYVYLDDEGSPSPSLSVPYWQGWSQTLHDFSRKTSSNKITLLPGLYCNFDQASWVALKTAVAQGSRCDSAWVARWKSSGGVCMPLQQWKDTYVTPDPAPPCPIHIWQYAQECQGGDGFDMDEANPGLPLDDLLKKSILPPR